VVNDRHAKQTGVNPLQAVSGEFPRLRFSELRMNMESVNDCVLCALLIIVRRIDAM